MRFCSPNSAFLCLWATLIANCIVATVGAATAPTIQANGEDLVFTWGKGETISMSEIASGLKACATKAELSKASPQRATGTADFTDPRAVTTIPLGKMSATEVARFAFTISGCASESSRGFSFLLTGNPSGNPSGGEAVDVFVTTVRPQDFSADGIAPYVPPLPPIHFVFG